MGECFLREKQKKTYQKSIQGVFHYFQVNKETTPRLKIPKNGLNY